LEFSDEESDMGLGEAEVDRSGKVMFGFGVIVAFVSLAPSESIGTIATNPTTIAAPRIAMNSGFILFAS
jgi:hypothetical protein